MRFYRENPQHAAPELSGGSLTRKERRPCPKPQNSERIACEPPADQVFEYEDRQSSPSRQASDARGGDSPFTTFWYQATTGITISSPRLSRTQSTDTHARWQDEARASGYIHRVKVIVSLKANSFTVIDKMASGFQEIAALASSRPAPNFSLKSALLRGKAPTWPQGRRRNLPGLSPASIRPILHSKFSGDTAFIRENQRGPPMGRRAIDSTISSPVLLARYVAMRCHPDFLTLDRGTPPSLLWNRDPRAAVNVWHGAFRCLGVGIFG